VPVGGIISQQIQGGVSMESTYYGIYAKKAMAFDLLRIIDADPVKTAFTAEEVKQIIQSYIESQEKI
jgi:hypothetical protein